MSITVCAKRHQQVDEHVSDPHCLHLCCISCYVVGSQEEPLGNLLRSMSHVVSAKVMLIKMRSPHHFHATYAQSSRAGNPREENSCG